MIILAITFNFLFSWCRYDPRRINYPPQTHWGSVISWWTNLVLGYWQLTGKKQIHYSSAFIYWPFQTFEEKDLKDLKFLTLSKTLAEKKPTYSFWGSLPTWSICCQIQKYLFKYFSYYYSTSFAFKAHYLWFKNLSTVEPLVYSHQTLQQWFIF